MSSKVKNAKSVQKILKNLYKNSKKMKHPDMCMLSSKKNIEKSKKTFKKLLTLCIQIGYTNDAFHKESQTNNNN